MTESSRAFTLANSEFYMKNYINITLLNWTDKIVKKTMAFILQIKIEIFLKKKKNSDHLLSL